MTKAGENPAPKPKPNPAKEPEAAANSSKASDPKENLASGPVNSGKKVTSPKVTPDGSKSKDTSIDKPPSFDQLANAFGTKKGDFESFYATEKGKKLIDELLNKWGSDSGFYKFISEKSALRVNNPEKLLNNWAANPQTRAQYGAKGKGCLLYTSPSPRDRTRSRMPSSA